MSRRVKNIDFCFPNSESVMIERSIKSSINESVISCLLCDNSPILELSMSESLMSELSISMQSFNDSSFSELLCCRPSIRDSSNRESV